MELLYGSTRGGETGVTASQAVLKGLADDGGLYVPERIPTLDVTMDELAGMTYQETAYAVMKQFLTDYTEEELKYMRDIAEQEAVNRYTTAEISVDMSGMQNNINNNDDIDGFVSKLTDSVNEAVDNMTEGVHK